MSHKAIPTAEPQVIAQGDTLEWTRTLPDFPASAWTLTYHFRGPGQGFNATAAADGDSFAITVEKGTPVSSGTTASMTPGNYYWQAWVVNEAGEYHIVDEGRVTVHRSLRAIPPGTTYDGRTQAEKDLDAVRAALAGNLDVAEYTIAGRTLKRRSKTELIALEHNLAQRVAAEPRAERLREGAPFFQNVLTRFK